MPSSLSALQRERVWLYLRILLLAAIIGAFYGVALAPAEVSPLVSILVGIANGVLISGSIAGIEIFLLREGTSMKRGLRLPFIAVVLLKTAVYAGIVSTVVLGAPQLARIFPGVLRVTPLERHTELITIGFSMGMTVIFVIIVQAAGLVGRRTFRSLVMGRYRRPRSERRFFLFVDVVGSTAIAERLGSLQAHRFLAAVFSATAEPVAACRGEIYQYVGDEIVVTWTEEEGVPEARPLRCFFLMEEALRAQRATFQSLFSVAPALRAALHLGDVIAGEVGEQRRAIVYSGDVMNTASRLEQATRDLGCRFIASATAVESFSLDEEFQLKDLGALNLRGRKQAIRAWAIDL